MSRRRKWTVEDFRGREVGVHPLLVPRNRWESEASVAVRVRPGVTRSMAWLSDQGVPWRVAVFLSSASGGAANLFWMVFLFGYFAYSVRRLLYSLGMVVMCVLVVGLIQVFFWIRDKRRPFEWVPAGDVRKCVEGGVCARCAYPVDGAPIEGDGAVVCPCCGAAWDAALGRSDRGVFRPSSRRMQEGFRTLFVTDDRGLRRRAFVPVLPPVLGGGSSRGHRMLSEYLKKREGILPYLFFCAAFVPLVIAMFLFVTGWPLNYGLVMVFFSGALMVAGRVIWGRQLSMHRWTLEGMFREERLCLSCGYDCSGLRVDEGDGCVVCPECSAAWGFEMAK